MSRSINLRTSERRKRKVVSYADLDGLTSESEEAGAGSDYDHDQDQEIPRHRHQPAQTPEDRAEAKARLDQIVQAGAISLMANKYMKKNPKMKPKPNPDPLTVTAVRYLHLDKDRANEIIFTCTVCLEKFNSMKDLSRHELFEHFVWAYKPLLMELLDIIDDDENFYCPTTDCNLRLKLRKCINGHQNKCPECAFASHSGDALVEHYKVRTSMFTIWIYFYHVSMALDRFLWIYHPSRFFILDKAHWQQKEQQSS